MTDAVWIGAIFFVRPSVIVVALGAGALIGQALQPWASVKVAFNVATDLLAISAAVTVFVALGSPSAPEATGWPAALAAVAAFQAVNSLLMGAIIALTERRSFFEVAVVPPDVASWTGNVALGILGAVLWSAEPASLPLLLVPVVLTHLAYQGWLRSARERDRMREMAHTAGLISRSGDLSKRVSERDERDAAGVLASTLNRMLERLEAAFKRERLFIRETSHELLTPITICRGHLEMLELEPDRFELGPTLELVMDELDRMGRIVDDMSTLAYMEDPAALRVAEVRIDRLLDDVAAKSRQLLNGRLHVVPAESSAAVAADPQRLTQALINLLKNACEHASADTPIELKAVEANGGGWRFEVTDRGGGLDPHDEHRVFDPFVAGPESEGSGLGLAIVRSVARAHGGSAGVDNDPGTGATFWVRLPK
jgi:signal transduction histidine kinase